MYRGPHLPAPIALLVALILFVAAGASAQDAATHGSIEGVVLDSAAGTPREGVNVSIDGTSRAMLTDDKGHFMFADVAAGTYTVRARQVGLRVTERSVVVQPAAVTRIVVLVQGGAVTLGTVNTKARTPERERFELSPRVGVIALTPSSVKDVPALGEPDVLRTVQLMPGVNARNDFSSGYNVRGGESDQNLILLDGFPIYNPFHLGGLFSTFLDETVGSIDLLTGGFSSPYGGRLSSVLDVTSQPATRTGIHGTSSVSVISSSLSVGSASADGRSSWTLSGRRTYADKLIAAISDKSFPYHFSDAQFHGERALNSGDLKLQVSAYSGADELDANLGMFQDSASKGSSAGGFLFGWANQLVGAKLSNGWHDHARLPLFGAADSVTVVQNVSFTRFSTGLNLAEGALTLDNSVREFRLQGALHWNKGTHERQVGYEASAYATHYDVSSAAFASQLFDLSQNPSALSVYYDERFKATDRLVTEVGVRAEHITGRQWTGISPRLSASTSSPTTSR